MKRRMAIFLLGIHMISFMEFHQFLRIPLLIKHFTVHRAQDPSMSVMDFLKLHYVGKFEVDEDYEQDKELPFRQTDCCVITTSVTCECPTSNIEIAGHSEELHNEFILYDEDNHSLISVADIFQPPRTV